MEIREGTVLKGRYRLGRLLGHGGMASVWRGHDRVLDRSVAVKVLSDAIASDPEFAARFRREATVAAGLSHPNLVRVYDYAEAGERPYLVMELVPGEDLGRLLAGRATVDRQRLAAQLLSALAHIHRAGIVHRDVKPQNVLVERDGNAKLIDFGIALPRDATALTSTGLVVATRSYAAPEVLRGQAASERSDLYSCGKVLEACGGKGGSPTSALIRRLVSAEPAARPASAAAALAQLEAAPDPLEPTAILSPVPPGPGGPEGGSPPPTRPAGQRPAHRGKRWAVALGLLAAFAAVAVAVAATLGGGGDGGGPSGADRATAGGGKAGAGKRQAGSDEPRRASAAPPGAEEAATPAVTPAGDDAARGSALNEEGFELIRAGRYEEAVPVLEESIRSFPPGTADIDYAYALFNLGDALLRSGRAEAAIPILERRLGIPNQTEVVRATLETARSEAGEEGEEPGE